MKKMFISLVITAIFIFMGVKNSPAQTEDSSHFFTVTTLKVPFEKIEDFLKNYEKYTTPVVKQNEFVLREKVLMHTWGPDYSVMIIDEYKTWSDIDAAGRRYDEIAVKMEPDKSKRDEYYKSFAQYYNGHTDAILNEAPKLTK